MFVCLGRWTRRSGQRLGEAGKGAVRTGVGDAHPALHSCGLPSNSQLETVEFCS